MSSVAADELDECGRDSYEGHIETELSEPEEESAEEKSVTAKYASGAPEEKADSATAIAIKGIIAILVLCGGIVIGAKVSKKRM